MNEAVIALISTVIGAGIPVVTLLISQRREDRREKHSQRERQLTELARLYEDAMVHLDTTARSYGTGAKEALDAAVRMRARMQLGSTSDIRDQYLTTGDALDSWAEEARQGAPQRIGSDLLLIGSPASPYQERGKALYPVYSDAYDKLGQMMRDHIESLKSAA